MVICLAVLLATCLQAEPPRESGYYQVEWPSVDSRETIDSESAIADLDYLVSRLYEVHPMPFRYTEESRFLQEVHEARALLSSREGYSITKEELYFILQRVAASLLDIHTFISRPTMQLDSIFPLQIRIIEGKIFNLGSYDDNHHIPTGAEILSISGVSSDVIVSETKKLMGTPMSEAAFRDIESLFIVYVDRLFSLNDPYIIEYSYQGQINVESVPALEAIPPALRTREEAVDSYVIETSDMSVPVLVLNRFFDDGDRSFFPYVREFFKEHSEASWVIIDARGNSGGSLTWGEYVLGHLTNLRTIQRSSDKFFRVSDTSTDKMKYELHNRYYHLGVPRFMWNWRVHWLFRETRHIGRVVYGKSGDMVETGPLVWRNPVDRRYRYDGESILLIDEKTGSAAVSFAAMFKSGEVGTIIGRETAHPDSYSGELTWHMLPESGLVFGLPISYVIAARGIDDGRGVLPDHEVIFSLEDIISRRDLDLELALELISAN